tara:strand:+ start:2892 stop:3695 length:804 start_codon:yes stop_codon:yes gene_type:complete
MQNQRNCHQNVWILSGTSDGPKIANELLRLNFTVFVSVISYKASKAYLDNPKLHIITGRIKNEEQIRKIIFDNDIKSIIDATHPFALIISKYLQQACEQVNKPLFTYERINHHDKKILNKRIISDLRGINGVELKNKNLLLAIGSRSLDEIAKYYMAKQANIYARILSTPQSIMGGFSSCIKESNLAILNPSKVTVNPLELFLCEYWEIDIILCRDSGGYSQIIWELISSKSDIDLFMLKRPKINQKNLVFSEVNMLIKSVKNIMKI